MEIWKDIKNLEGKYQVSNLGNVRNKKTFVVLNPRINKYGYRQIIFKYDGKEKTKLVHRLVAEAFLENPNGYEIVNHIDYNRLNNNVDNLEWCTVADNVHHSIERMKIPHKRIGASGEKYIVIRNGKFRVRFKGFSYTSSSLQDAINVRDEQLKKLGGVIVWH